MPYEELHRAIRAEHSGRYDEARHLLREEVDSGNKHVDIKLRLGKLLIRHGPPGYDEANSLLTAALQQAKSEGAAPHAAQAINLLALVERQRGNLDQAQRLLDEHPAMDRISAPSPEAAQWFHYRGLIAADRHDFADAERLYFRAHELYVEIDYESGLAEVCDSLANLMLRRGNSCRALAFAERSLSLKMKLEDRYGQAISSGTIGRAYFLQARYLEAIEAFKADLAIATELNDQVGVGIMLNSIGEASMLSGQLELAADYYSQNSVESRGALNVLHAYLGLARVRLSTGDIVGAAQAVKDLESKLADVPAPRELGDALTGIKGAVAWRQGDMQEGERLLNAAISAFESNGDPLDSIPYLYELRDLYQSQGNTEAAVRMVATALDLLSECGSERGIADLEKWLRSVDSPALIRLALERHFPDYLAEGILSGQLRLQPAKRQDVTVLFSDVRGYTALSESLPPEDTVELLNEWFAEATRAIRRHGGMVDKFIGDAVMAIFGLPESREDAAADAVRTALDMRDAVSALNLRHRALGREEIQIGIGVHTGNAVVGFVGSHLRQSYTVIGDAVNIASRLESATKNYPGCDILISETTEQAQQKEKVAVTEFLDCPALEGKQKRIPVFAVRGHRSPVS